MSTIDFWAPTIVQTYVSKWLLRKVLDFVVQRRRWLDRPVKTKFMVCVIYHSHRASQYWHRKQEVRHLQADWRNGKTNSDSFAKSGQRTKVPLAREVCLCVRNLEVYFLQLNSWLNKVCHAQSEMYEIERFSFVADYRAYLGWLDSNVDQVSKNNTLTLWCSWCCCCCWCRYLVGVTR